MKGISPSLMMLMISVGQLMGVVQKFAAIGLFAIEMPRSIYTYSTSFDHIRTSPCIARANWLFSLTKLAFFYKCVFTHFLLKPPVAPCVLLWEAIKLLVSLTKEHFAGKLNFCDMQSRKNAILGSITRL